MPRQDFQSGCAGLMNIYAEYRNSVVEVLLALAEEGVLPKGLDYSRITVEPPREVAHGDLATNAAMVLAKQASMQPRDLANHLAEKLRAVSGVTHVEVAGPGFINLRLSFDRWCEVLQAVLRSGTAFGASDRGAGIKVNVEYVSANPTGPLHIGHARGTVFGDALASLLEKVGYEVCREYYINDAGAQVDALGRSVHLRYREVLGEEIGDIVVIELLNKSSLLIKYNTIKNIDIIPINTKILILVLGENTSLC